MMSRLIFVSLVTIFLVSLAGCGNHKKHYRYAGIADVNTNTNPIDEIDDVTVNFWDSLSDEDKQRIIDQIRQEIIAWEIEHQQHIEDIVFDILFSANYDVNITIEITPEGILIGCVDPESFDLPPGILKKLLCSKQECSHQEEDDDEDSDS